MLNLICKMECKSIMWGLVVRVNCLVGELSGYPSMQQLPSIFIIIACTQSSTHQCLCDYIILPHSYVFVLKRRESSINLLKDNGQKDFKIHIEVLENY